MANFNGVQSLNGIQSAVPLFTAPATGAYFIQGYLTLPQLISSGSASAVIATVAVNGGSASYTGVAGASGFAIPSLSLTAGDAVTVGLASSTACDLVSNAVSGQVYFGNAV